MLILLWDIQAYKNSAIFLQWKQNLFSLGIAGLQYLQVSIHTTDVHLFLI